MVTGAPEGWHSITPRFFVDDPAACVEFLKHAFGGEGEMQGEAPAEIRIGDSIVLVSGTSVREPMPACLYLYLADADAACSRALAAGATSLEEMRDTPYGDRRGMVRDPFGNVWQIATRRDGA